MDEDAELARSDHLGEDAPVPMCGWHSSLRYRISRCRCTRRLPLFRFAFMMTFNATCGAVRATRVGTATVFKLTPDAAPNAPAPIRRAAPYLLAGLDIAAELHLGKGAFPDDVLDEVVADDFGSLGDLCGNMRQRIGRADFARGSAAGQEIGCPLGAFAYHDGVLGILAILTAQCSARRVLQRWRARIDGVVLLLVRLLLAPRDLAALRGRPWPRRFVAHRGLCAGSAFHGGSPVSARARRSHLPDCAPRAVRLPARPATGARALREQVLSGRCCAHPASGKAMVNWKHLSRRTPRMRMFAPCARTHAPCAVRRRTAYVGGVRWLRRTRAR